MEDATAPPVAADILRDATDAKGRLEKKIATDKSADGKVLTAAEKAVATRLLAALDGLFEQARATGDLLVRPVPYAFDGYRGEWIRTLQGLAALDADTIVPGHGEVMPDKSYLMQVIALMKCVVTQVDAQLRRNSDVSLADVTKAVDLTAFRESMAGDEAIARRFFDNSNGSKFIELADHELKQR